MRTTTTLVDDVVVAMDGLRRGDGVGMSEVVNRLVRAGLAHHRPVAPYVPRSHPMGITLDVSNIGEVLDLLDQQAP